MQSNIYFFDDYRSFLNDLIAKNEDIKGFRTKLAEAARCQKSFLSQVMAGKVHLTPEHAANLAQAFSLNEDEAGYLLDLVLLGRAGTDSLKKMLKTRIQRKRSEKKRISSSFESSHQIDFKHQAAFYSQWYVSAVYMVLGQTQNYKNIAERFGIPESVVRTAVETLVDIGLIVRDKSGVFQKTQHNLFLRDSPFRNNFRSGWRTVGLLKQQLPERDSTFFTMLWSISKAQREEIWRVFAEAIANANKLADQDQKEEDLICVNLDFFDL